VDVQLGRIDSGGVVDLAALDADGRVTIALNNGTGYWRSVRTYDLGIGPANGLALSNFGSDPFLDLVVQGPNSLVLARGDGTGRFDVAQTVTPGPLGTLAPGSGRVGLATGLLNNDVFTDLVTVAPGTNEVLVFLGNARGTLGTPDRYPSGGLQPDAVVIGDFVGDALPDLAVGHLDGTVTFLQGLPGGKFQPRPDLTVRGLGPVVGMTTGNFDGSGDSEIAVSGTTQVTLLKNNHHAAQVVPLTNGDFSQGLTGWTVTGPVIASGGFAQFAEGGTQLTQLRQTFTVPNRPTMLSFDLVALGLEDPIAGNLPDAFEASLLDGQGNPLVAPFRPEATAFFNANPRPDANSQPNFSTAPGVSFDGRHVSLDISHLAPGTQAVLSFDLIGNPPGISSTASVANVQVSNQLALETFTAATLQGPFRSTAGIAAGDVDGDGRSDLVVADAGANQLLVFNGDGSGGFTRSPVDASNYGTMPRAVAAAPLTASMTTDDVAVTLAGSDRVLSPLIYDNVPPTATLLDPDPNQVRNQDVSRVRLQYSEMVRDVGPAGSHSVSNPAAYALSNTTTNQKVPIASVAYEATTHWAIVTPAADFTPLADGAYRLVVNGSDPVSSVQDLAGNPLNGGRDAVFTFTVDRTAPVVSLSLTPSVLWPPNHTMVNVHAQLSGPDAADPSLRVTLLSIKSNEPDVSPGSGNFPNDIQNAALGTDDRDFSLRSEREGQGSGRVYTVTYLVQDAAGNGRVIAANVVVPHDEGQGLALLDSLGNATPPGLGSLQTATVSQVNNRSFQVDTVVRGAIAVPGAVDVWSFTGSAGQRLFFDAQAGSSTVLHWFLTDPHGNLRFTDDFQDHDTLTLTQAGTYYLTLDARSGQTGSYQFQVWNVPEPVEIPLAFGQMVQGSLTIPGSQARYTFSAGAGQRVFFDMLNSGGQLRFALQGPDGATLLTPDNQNQHNRLVLPVAGLYTVVVGHGAALDATGVYQFQIDNLPPDVSQPMVLNTPIAGALAVPGQTLTYTFRANLGQQLLLAVTGNQAGAINFSLQTPTGATIFANQSGNQVIASIPATGTYTLMIQASGDAVGC
jgi:hypothetical protein